MNKPVKYVFISSTISDLEQERAFVKQYIESYDIVSITCLLSESPDFPITPSNLSKDTYHICIENLLKCDYVIQLLNRRYGVSDIEDAGEFISIMHKEYREAFRNRLTVFTIAHKKLWDAYNAYKKGKPQAYVDNTQKQLFALLDEAQGHQRKKWIFRYETISDIETILRNSFFVFDDSIFVSDVTFPDGSSVKVNEKFEKIWEIKNNGLIVFENRFLKEENPGCGLKPECSLVPLPRTLPGENLQISVVFTAPQYPGTYESYWKMVDASGRQCFPWKKGVRCCVKVIY